MLPSGVAIGNKKSFPGSVADIWVLREMLQCHRQETKKEDYNGGELSDDGDSYLKFRNHWEILADEGYSSLKEQIRIIISKKKRVSGLLNVADKNRKKSIFHERIIVENVFGRLCTVGLFS